MPALTRLSALSRLPGSGRRRLALLAAPVVLAGAAVAGVTLWPDGASGDLAANATTTLGIPERDQEASRGEPRPTLPAVTPNAAPTPTATPTPT
ncbi:hypothetical protein C1I92_18430, partial [Jiangella anatolica]